MQDPFDGDVTHDGFLDRRLMIWQPRIGYRAATDPVLLAASVPALPGQTVLDLGCGVGVASLCLGARVAGLQITGLEIQPEYAALCERNSAENRVALEVLNADLTNPPPDVKQRVFDHVLTNPPYLSRNAGTSARDTTREKAFREEVSLDEWIDSGLKRLKPNGVFTIIHLAERLPDLLASIGNRLGGIEVKPIAPRQNRAAGRIILRGRKGSKGSFCLHDPFIVHHGLHHDGDKESLSAAATRILRAGSALRF